MKKGGIQVLTHDSMSLQDIIKAISNNGQAGMAINSGNTIFDSKQIHAIKNSLIKIEEDVKKKTNKVNNIMQINKCFNISQYYQNQENMNISKMIQFYKWCKHNISELNLITEYNSFWDKLKYLLYVRLIKQKEKLSKLATQYNGFIYPNHLFSPKKQLSLRFEQILKKGKQMISKQSAKLYSQIGHKGHFVQNFYKYIQLVSTVIGTKQNQHNKLVREITQQQPNIKNIQKLATEQQLKDQQQKTQKRLVSSIQKIGIEDYIQMTKQQEVKQYYQTQTKIVATIFNKLKKQLQIHPKCNIIEDILNKYAEQIQMRKGGQFNVVAQQQLLSDKQFIVEICNNLLQTRAFNQIKNNNAILLQIKKLIGTLQIKYIQKSVNNYNTSKLLFYKNNHKIWEQQPILRKIKPLLRNYIQNICDIQNTNSESVYKNTTLNKNTNSNYKTKYQQLQQKIDKICQNSQQIIDYTNKHQFKQLPTHQQYLSKLINIQKVFVQHLNKKQQSIHEMPMNKQLQEQLIKYKQTNRKLNNQLCQVKQSHIKLKQQLQRVKNINSQTQLQKQTLNTKIIQKQSINQQYQKDIQKLNKTVQSQNTLITNRQQQLKKQAQSKSKILSKMVNIQKTIITIKQQLKQLKNKQYQITINDKCIKTIHQQFTNNLSKHILQQIVKCEQQIQRKQQKTQQRLTSNDKQALQNKIFFLQKDKKRLSDTIRAIKSNKDIPIKIEDLLNTDITKQLNTRINQLQTENKQLTQQLTKYKQGNSESEQLQKIKKANNDKQQAICELNKQIQNYKASQQKLGILIETNRKQQQKIEELKKQINKLRQQNVKTIQQEKQQQKQQQQHQHIHQQKQQIIRKNTISESVYIQIQPSVKQTPQNCKQQQEHKDTLKAQLQDLTTKIQKLRCQNDKLDIEYQQKMQQLQTIDRQINTKKAKLQRIQSNTNPNNINIRQHNLKKQINQLKQTIQEIRSQNLQNKQQQQQYKQLQMKYKRLQQINKKLQQQKQFRTKQYYKSQSYSLNNNNNSQNQKKSQKQHKKNKNFIVRKIQNIKIQPQKINKKQQQQQKIVLPKLPIQKSTVQSIYCSFNLKIQLTIQQKQLIHQLFKREYSKNKQHRNYTIVKTQPLFFYPEMDSINFHKLVDQIPNIVILVKIKGLQHTIVVYSELALSKQTANINYHDYGTFLAVIKPDNPQTTSKIYYLNRNNHQSRSFIYNDYYIVVGNSDLRIKRSDNKAQSNIPTTFQYFNTPGQSSPYFMFGTHYRSAQIQRYQIHKLIIEEQP